MFQQIILVGNLGQDPEMRYTPSGVPVTSFSLAVNRVWTGQDGQRQEKTTWFRVTAWQREAELASQYLSKGRQVLVIGEVEEARPWTDRDGNQRASLEVRARTIRFIGGRGDAGMGGGYGDEEHAASGSGSGNAPAANDEDIPF
ncbi:MAG: single-stranded DNA-binding protein [Chloroflexota bacterium]|nr:single-stranded DNA-binding protein [Chloroflexota bacterium]